LGENMKSRKIIAALALISILSTYTSSIAYATECLAENIIEEQEVYEEIQNQDEQKEDLVEGIQTSDEEKVEEKEEIKEENKEEKKEHSLNSIKAAADTEKYRLTTYVKWDYLYTGEEIEFEKPTIKDWNKNGYCLVEEVDYTISYSREDKVSVGHLDAIYTGIGNYEGWSCTISFCIMPRPIQNVEVEEYTDTSIKVKWDKYQYDCEKITVTVNKVVNEYLYYEQSVDLDAESQEYEITGLDPQCEYRIAVSSVVNDIYSSTSKIAYTRPIEIAKNIEVKKSDDTAVISWTKSKDLSYEVYVKNILDSDYTLLGETSNNSLNVDASKINDGYQIMIKTYFDTEEYGKIYAKEDALYYEEIVPESVSGEKISQELKGLKIEWNKVQDVSGYKIYRSSERDGDYSLVKTINDSETLEYLDTSVKTGGKYYYKVYSYNELSGSDYLSSESNILYKCFVKGITSVSVRSYGTSAKLTWGKVGDATGYKIYRATSINGLYSNIKTIGKNTTLTYTDKNKNGTVYFYKVRAYYKNGSTTYYSNFSDIKEKKPYAKAEVTVSYNSSKYVLVKWKKISGIKGYTIYRSTTKNGTYTKIKTISSAKTLSYKDKNLTLGEGYYYKVRGYNGSKYGEMATPKLIGTGTITQQVNKKLKISTTDMGDEDINASLDYLIEKAYAQAKSKENNPCKTNYQKIKAIYRYVETNLKHADGYNCWHFSGTFCAALNRIGVKAYCVAGQTKSTSGSMTAHTWVQLNINGVKYMLDPSIDRHISDQLGKKVRYDRFLVKVSSLKNKYKDYGEKGAYSYLVDFRNKGSFCWFYYTERP